MNNGSNVGQKRCVCKFRSDMTHCTGSFCVCFSFIFVCACFSVIHFTSDMNDTEQYVSDMTHSAFSSVRNPDLSFRRFVNVCHSRVKVRPKGEEHCTGWRGSIKLAP